MLAELETDEQAAHRIADGLSKRFDAQAFAVSLFDAGRGRWKVAIHFRGRIDEEAVRAAVGAAAGTKAARVLGFARVEETDWVRKSLARLGPVAAGRFIVHGAHDRTRVPVNRIGIEIEAALAFGTGHHGTTRGCLLLLDHVLKAHRPRRVLDLGTGTAVLAIAAAKALHGAVLASDIDPLSVKVARDNARCSTSCLPAVLARAAASFHVTHALAVCPVCS